MTSRLLGWRSARRTASRRLPGRHDRVEGPRPGDLALPRRLAKLEDLPSPAIPTFISPSARSSAGEASLKIESTENSGPVSVRTSWSPARPSRGGHPRRSRPSRTTRGGRPTRSGSADRFTGRPTTWITSRTPTKGKPVSTGSASRSPRNRPSSSTSSSKLLDRDVSANLRVHRLDPASGEVRPYELGKDPMEIVHDRERERYSTHLSRTLTRGTYFVEVNANHPDYILRTRGDTRSRHSPNLRRRSRRASITCSKPATPGSRKSLARGTFSSGRATSTTPPRAARPAMRRAIPTEAALVGLANGYPIRAKSSMLYLMDRLANSPTPLYGDDGLYWQRFIAIPLQAQGKQGGIVLDFERQVLEPRIARSPSRFGPFLLAAWRGRQTLPADEVERRGPARQQVRPRPGATGGSSPR